jgi:hypothetical protein
MYLPALYVCACLSDLDGKCALTALDCAGVLISVLCFIMHDFVCSCLSERVDPSRTC